jgi:hypothetical protein
LFLVYILCSLWVILCSQFKQTQQSPAQNNPMPPFVVEYTHKRTLTTVTINFYDDFSIATKKPRVEMGAARITIRGSGRPGL